MNKIFWLFICAVYFSMSLSSYAVFEIRNESDFDRNLNISIYSKVKKIEIDNTKQQPSSQHFNIASRIIPFNSLIGKIENRNDTHVQNIGKNINDDETIICNKLINEKLKAHRIFQLNLENYTMVGMPLFLTIYSPPSSMLFLFTPEDLITTEDLRRRIFTRDYSAYGELTRLLEKTLY